MPATPRWLLALPDAITQLEALDQDLLTRRDLERRFGVSKVRATQLMTAFGAGRTGHLLTLPRAALLRPRLIVDAGPVAVEKFLELLRRTVTRMPSASPASATSAHRRAATRGAATEGVTG